MALVFIDNLFYTKNYNKNINIYDFKKLVKKTPKIKNLKYLLLS